MDQREEERIRNLLLEPVSEENPPSEASDEDCEDEVEESEHNTNSELSADEVEEHFDRLRTVPIYDVNLHTNYIYGKDNVTKWYLCWPLQNVRRPAHNILRMHLPGVIGEAKNATTKLECFNLFFTPDMTEEIVNQTNKKIAQLRPMYNRERDAKDTDLLEMNGFFGLLFLSGMLKSSHVNLEDLYKKDFTGVEFFRTTMAERRFRFLLRAIRFDDSTTRNERRQLDKLAPIRHIFDSMNSNCRKHYSIGEHTTIDEMLEPFRGRCPFRQYIKSKPSKYGIKIFALADAKTFYCSNMEVYCGNQPDGPYKVSNAASEVVLRLIQPISNSGRNVTVDNFFTSVPLANKLSQDHKLSLVGTLRKNKREIPAVSQYITHTDRQLYSSVFLYGENATLLSYKSKPNKVVLLLSTMHRSDDIDEESGAEMKPEMLVYYNKTKGGVDTLDKLKATYNVGRKTNRWPLALFFAMMNIAAVNAFIVYVANSQENLNRRDFLKLLSKELCIDLLKQRATMENLPRQLKSNIKKCPTICRSLFILLMA